MPRQKTYTAQPSSTRVAGVNAPPYVNEDGIDLGKVAEMFTPPIESVRNITHDIGTLLGVNSDRYRSTVGDAYALAMAAIPARRLTLTHFRRHPHEVLSGKFLGKGAASEELKRSIPKTKFWSAYTSEPFEKRIVDQFPVKHIIKGKFKVFDMASKEGEIIIEKARKIAYAKKGGDISEEMHRLAKEAGYDIVMNSDQPYSNIVRVLRDMKATKIILPKKTK